jgi:hypothetical protein
MQLQLSGFLIDHRAEQPAVGPGHGHFCKWRDGVIVPVICPTCQNVFAGPVKTSMLAAKSYFAWGCFRYFSLEGARRWPCGSLSALLAASSGFA